ncbi:MAG: hypothetical protein ACI8S3_001422 [Alphaproteobacteria bacterium]
MLGSLSSAQFDPGTCEPAVKIVTTSERPPTVKEGIDGLPVGHPADDKQAFAKTAGQWSCTHIRLHEMACNETDDEYWNADQKIAPPHTEQLFCFAVRDASPISKVVAKCRRKILPRCTGDLTLRQVHQDLNFRSSRQFACPGDDVLFGIIIEVAFEEGCWIERVEELFELGNANLYNAGRNRLTNHGRLPRVGMGNRTNVWRYPGVNTFREGRAAELRMHPTVKPVALVADAIRDATHRGDVVLDNFVGSGTTIMAAQQVGRLAYGMDLDPLYIDTAIRRWQEAGGEKAQLASSGETFTDVESRRCEEMTGVLNTLVDGRTGGHPAGAGNGR